MENTRPQIVHCVRHAQGIHNLTIENHGLLDPVLTVFGEQQCHELARDFTGHNNVELVVASPLKRTVYTALSAFAPVLSRGRAVVCLPEIQETTDLPCDTGSDLETIQQVFKGLPVDLSLVVEGWQVKRGRWAKSVTAIEQRVDCALKWLKSRPEREIVLVSHGCFLHFLTGDWVDAVNNQATSWKNCEYRSFVLDEDVECRISLTETSESRRRRGLEETVPDRDQQLKMKQAVLQTWEQWGIISNRSVASTSENRLEPSIYYKNTVRGCVSTMCLYSWPL